MPAFFSLMRIEIEIRYVINWAISAAANQTTEGTKPKFLTESMHAKKVTTKRATC